MPHLPNFFGLDLLQGGPNILTTTLSGLGILPPQWGIFNQDGESVVTADNVVSFEDRRDWNVADYPMERGAFESYDKVATPFGVRVAFSSGGSFANRKRLITSIDEIAGDLELYDVVTPEKTYLNVNVMHHDMRRTADNGAGLVTVNVWLTEIRENAVAETAESAEPSGAQTKDGGQVQPTTPTDQNESLIHAAFNAP